MIKLNDYLYSGNTIFRILRKYTSDLRTSALENKNEVDLVHAGFLMQITDILEHNEFLTAQSQRIRGFYQQLAREYPYLAFTLKGRIKSLIRAEEKFNGYVIEHIHDYYVKNGEIPPLDDLRKKLTVFRDLIAYRIVISMPSCRIEDKEARKEEEVRLIYRIAGELVTFMEAQGFTPEISSDHISSRLGEDAKKYYRDYIEHPAMFGYQSLHITFFDNNARCYIEMQLRTKEMDDYSEIGPANHLGYEKYQDTQRQRNAIPEGISQYFDEAYERVLALQSLDLSKIDVNMFAAVNNSLINDGCGLFRGRAILPYEHLSRFQNNLID